MTEIRHIPHNAWDTCGTLISPSGFCSKCLLRIEQNEFKETMYIFLTIQKFCVNV